nr:hypothetical protein [Geobacter sp. OR-1]
MSDQSVTHVRQGYGHRHSAGVHDGSDSAVPAILSNALKKPLPSFGIVATAIVIVGYLFNAIL